MTDKAFTDPIAELFDSERFSDMTIICEGRTIHAHKAIVCTHSDFFAKACEGGFKEGQTGVIELKDDNLQAVLAVLSFLYTKDYSGLTPHDTAPLTFNVRVFALAEKYFIKSLLDLAARKFKAILKDKYVEDEFAEAVEEWTAITSDEDRVLGKIIVESIMARRQDLLNPNKTSSRFRGMMDRTPWMAAEVAMMLSSEDSGAEDVGVYICAGGQNWGGRGCRFLTRCERGKRYNYICPNCRHHGTLIPERDRDSGYHYAHLEEI